MLLAFLALASERLEICSIGDSLNRGVRHFFFVAVGISYCLLFFVVVGVTTSLLFKILDGVFKILDGVFKILDFNLCVLVVPIEMVVLGRYVFLLDYVVWILSLEFQKGGEQFEHFQLGLLNVGIFVWGFRLQILPDFSEYSFSFFFTGTLCLSWHTSLSKEILFTERVHTYIFFIVFITFYFSQYLTFIWCFQKIM